MKNSIEMVVFDMAGTTVDEQNVVYKTLKHAIEQVGLELSLEFVLKHGAGKEKHQAIKDILNELKVKNLDSQVIFENFKEMLKQAYEKLNVKPVKGVEGTFKLLKEKGIYIVLNTGYSRPVAESLIQKLNWQEGLHSDSLITASDVEKGRPSPEMIHLAMKQFNIENAKCVLKAGDSAIDIEEGKNANCGIIVGVLSGAQNRVQLEAANPTYILGSLSDLNTIL